MRIEAGRVFLACAAVAVAGALTACGGGNSSHGARQTGTPVASATANSESTALRTPVAGQGTHAAPTALRTPVAGQGTHAAPTALRTPVAGQGTSAEVSFARSMLLTLADFPAGWVHTATDPSQDLEEPTPDPLLPCVSSALAGQTGKAIGGEFSDENTTHLSVNPSVYIFDSAANAQSAAHTIISDIQCFADSVGSGIDVDPSFALGETHTEPLAAGAFGATAAIRLSETQIYKSDQPPHSDVLVFDIVIVVDGRVLYEVEGFQRFTPIDQVLLKRYVDQARAKIRQEP